MNTCRCGKKFRTPFKKHHSGQCPDCIKKLIKLREKFSSPAALAVRKAIKEGKLPDLKLEHIKCTDCQDRATTYDHREYKKPLEVDPVCKSCNAARGPAKEVKNLRVHPVKKTKKNIWR